MRLVTGIILIVSLTDAMVVFGGGDREDNAMATDSIQQAVNALT